MVEVLQVLAVLVVAVAMALSLAHALELPGKLRLDRDAYVRVQTIYYPGFSYGGFAEPIGLLVLLALMFLLPAGRAAFWLTFGAFVAFLAMHATYWLVTHPVNNFWLKDFELKGFGAGFFGFDPLKRGGSGTPDWTVLRDRWEYSHVLRAGLALLSLILLATAIAV
jgi:hypothetical protein